MLTESLHTRRRRAHILWVAVGLYLLGAILHLQILSFEAGRIWGDAGDGFFTLWAMNHVTEAVARGDWAIADGRIFWPEHQQTFFWSENLIAIAPLFAMSRGLMSGALLDAFWLTGLLLSILHFSALLFFFHQVYALCRTAYPRLPAHAIYGVPVLAYLTHFTGAVLVNQFLHLQNLSVAGVFVLTGAILGYRRTPLPRWLLVMGAALLFLVLSALYYAVIAAVLLIAWAALELAANPQPLWRAAWRAKWGLLLMALPVAWVAGIYLQSAQAAYAMTEVKRFSIDWVDWVRPAYGALQPGFDLFMEDSPRMASERIAWLGPGLILGLLAMLFYQLHRHRAHVAVWIKKPLFWLVALSILLLLLKVRELRPVLCWYGVFFFGVSFLLWIRYVVSQSDGRPLPIAAGYLGMAVVLMYGIAFGPHTYYLHSPVNPSIWGMLALWVPGFGGMRAVGRMAYPGHVFLLALLAAGVWTLYARATPAARKWLVLAVAVGSILQAFDASSIRAPQRTYPESLIRATESERDFFTALEGSIVVLPATPFHHNTIPMLYFSEFPALRLMNGYSGRSTAVWEEVMRREYQHGPASPQQLDYILKQGVDYVVIRTDRTANLEPHPLHGEQEPLFQNERWTVYNPPHGFNGYGNAFAPHGLAPWEREVKMRPQSHPRRSLNRGEE